MWKKSTNKKQILNSSKDLDDDQEEEEENQKDIKYSEEDEEEEKPKAKIIPKSKTKTTRKSKAKKSSKPKGISKRAIKIVKKPKLEHKEEEDNEEKESPEIKLTFQVHKKPIRNKKYFVYKEKRYEVDFELLKINSEYFYNNKKQFKYIECINILNEEEENQILIPEEAIQAFIASCNNDPCQISLSSVIALNYLSQKFQFTELIQITTDFFNAHQIQLALKSLLFKTAFRNIAMNTRNEEEIISNNLNHFIKDDEMSSLPINVLKNIIDKYFNLDKEHKKDEINEVFEFLFKILDRKGKDASILFNGIDFKQDYFIIFNRLNQYYIDKFDFNMISSTLSKITIDMSNKSREQKEQIAKLSSQLKELTNKYDFDMEKMMNENKKLKNEIEKESKKLKDHINTEKSNNTKLQDENEALKNEIKSEKDEIEKLENQILINEMQIQKEKTHSENIMSKCCLNIVEVIGLEKFNDLNEEFKAKIIDDIINKKIQISEYNDKNG